MRVALVYGVPFAIGTVACWITEALPQGSTASVAILVVGIFGAVGAAWYFHEQTRSW